jgi:hypothetical protein
MAEVGVPHDGADRGDVARVGVWAEQPQRRIDRGQGFPLTFKRTFGGFYLAGQVGALPAQVRSLPSAPPLGPMPAAFTISNIGQ